MSHLFVIISLLSAGLVILFLFNGTFVWPGSQPENNYLESHLLVRPPVRSLRLPVQAV